MKRRAKERAAKREHKANLHAANVENGVGKTAAQIDAANRYESYMRGWRDGAVITAMRPEFTERAPGDQLRIAYELGYGDGRKARSNASSQAASVYGHKLTILRLQDES